MFWIISLLAVGGASFAIDRMAPAILIIVGIFLMVFPILMGLVYVNDATGITSFLNSSWMFISGETPGTMVANCPSDSYTYWALILWPLAMVAMIFAAAGGAIAIGALPIGLGWSVIGGIQTLFTKDGEYLEGPLKLLGYGLSAVVGTGLLFRLIHFLTAASC